VDVLTEVCRRLSAATSVARETAFLYQRISVAILNASVTSVIKTKNPCVKQLLGAMLCCIIIHVYVIFKLKLSVFKVKMPTCFLGNRNDAALYLHASTVCATVDV